MQENNYTFQRTLMRFYAIVLLGIVPLWGACDKPDGEGDPVPVTPMVSIGSVTLPEGDENREFSFQVLLSEAIGESVSVNYTTEGGTAEAGSDFISTSGTLTIPAGERTGFVIVEIVADTLKEQDEQFKVVISNPQNATIQQAEGTGTIRNDDTFIDIPPDGYITPENYAGYNLIWQDEFDGTSLNLADWTFEIWAPYTVNNELQYYTDRSDNLYLSDGALVIEAKEESYSGADYTSARIITANKQSFTYGRVDIRAILPEGQGLWPALWMLGENIFDIGWPACGEIDIMELVGHEPSTVHGTIHWGPEGQGYSNYIGQGYSLSGEKFSDKYHVFSIIWEPNSITWLVDDNEFYSITNDDVNGAYPFNQEFFFIFNVAVGGDWPGSPDASTQFPQRMYVDYIRIFQE